jgi:hypothetical protein
LSIIDNIRLSGGKAYLSCPFVSPTPKLKNTFHKSVFSTRTGTEIPLWLLVYQEIMERTSTLSYRVITYEEFVQWFSQQFKS